MKNKALKLLSLGLASLVMLGTAGCGKSGGGSSGGKSGKKVFDSEVRSAIEGYLSSQDQRRD